jgi:hypothetical protein
MTTPSGTNISPEIEREIEELYSSCESFSKYLLVGLLIPAVLIILAAIGWGKSKKVRLLRESPELRSMLEEFRAMPKSELDSVSVDPSTRGRMAFLFLNEGRFRFPLYIVCVVLIFIMIVVAINHIF